MYIQPSSDVFINELHYDNAGGDVGEFFEIAGISGTDLSGWTVALYNGSNDTVYRTEALSGVLPEAGSGFGVLSFPLPSNGLQNGARDCLALVDPSGKVREFISYEGSLTASGGPADALTSTDIGVSESSSTPVGYSLQRQGSGSSSAEFEWAEASAESPGEVNAQQTFSGAPSVTPGPDDSGSGGSQDPVEPLTPPTTLISAIQGSGDASPLEGEVHQIEAIVTSILPDLNGFYVQEQVSDQDSDASTSEGLFVYDPQSVFSGAVGDLVQLSGTVAEYATTNNDHNFTFDDVASSLTQLTSIDALEVLSSGHALPPATDFTLPASSIGEFESVEGMLIRVTAGADPLTVTNTYTLGRYGEVALSAAGVFPHSLKRTSLTRLAMQAIWSN